MARLIRHRRTLDAWSAKVQCHRRSAAHDDLARVAAQICAVPVALVSLVDEDRQWFKSRIGFALAETPRDHPFCAAAILDPAQLLIVEDARVDPRFADSPLVQGESGVRFYAGAPLVTDDGHALGTLCVIDRKPRVLSNVQLDCLRALSRQIVTHLELRRLVKRLELSLGELAATCDLLERLPDAAVLPDAPATPPATEFGEAESTTFFVLEGRVIWLQAEPLFDAAMAVVDARRPLVIDLSACQYLDSAVLGTLHEVAERAGLSGVSLELQGVGPSVRNAFVELGLRALLDRVTDPPAALPAKLDVLELPVGDLRRYRRRLLRAHEVLAGLGDSNRAAFAELIDTLKEE